MIRRGLDMVSVRSREVTDTYDLGGDGKRTWMGFDHKYLRNKASFIILIMT